ncbi:MAG: glycosyltransferase family 39 protein [Nitrospinota bacterium]|nr:glycosyltransferase family 39 protein [Nitrospinota bacterium]
MSAVNPRKWLFILPAAVIAVEAMALCAYLAWGGFDFSLPLVGRVYLDHWLKPFQVILACLIIMAITYAFPPGALAALGAMVKRAWEAVAQRRHGMAIGAIIAVALLLRIWSLGHGIPTYVFWIDAPQFIEAAQEYVKGNYLHETGYPHFSSHFVEWAFRGANGVAGFMGFEAMIPESNILSLIARILNLGYVLGMMAVIYRIGVMVGMPAAGRLGMFFLAVSTINVQMSHYFINDMAMAFFSLLSIAAMARNLEEERLRWYLLAGALAGVSFACKYNGVMSFVFMGFIYLQLHRDRKSFIAWLGAPIRAGLLFIAVYVALSPSLWTSPLEKYLLTDRIAAGIAEPKGVPYIEVTGLKLMDGFLMFFYNWRYQLWVLEGLFHPLPLWLAFPSFAYAAYRRRWRLLFLWAGAMAAFVIGKAAKPNAAGWHMMNISPFLLLMAAVGITDALERINIKPLRQGLMAVLCLLMVHGAVQDASFWTLPPVKSSAEIWKAENIGDDGNVALFVELEREKGEPRDRILQEFNSGSRGGAYSVLRDVWWYVSLKKGAADYFPTAHIGSTRRSAQIFPVARDLVTTDRVFATGPGTGMDWARRFVLADDAQEQMLALGLNAHPGPNELRLTFGRVAKTMKLERGGGALIAVKRDDNRAFLLEGSHVKLRAESEKDAVWMIGANLQDMGDMYLGVGQLALAVQTYAQSRTPYSLLKIMAVADKIDTRLNAFAELEKSHPRFFKAITTTPPEKLEWEQIAGYSETVFASKAEMRLPLEKFKKVGMPADSHVLLPGASMYGPHMALTAGDYILKLKWMTRREQPASFGVELATGRGDDRKITRPFQGAEAESGAAAIPFTVSKTVDYPLEIRLEASQGGPVILEEVILSIDYLGHARKVISQGLAGLKSKKL